MMGCEVRRLVCGLWVGVEVFFFLDYIFWVGKEVEFIS